MSLPEKKTSSNPSLSQKSYGTAIVNMILGVALCIGVILMRGLKENCFSKRDFFSCFARGFEAFIFLTFIGFIVSLIPTLIGAKVLSAWLQRNNATRKSATIVGAAIGAAAISILTVSISVFWLITKFMTSFEDITFLFTANLLVAICAALAGGRTGFQLAKFIETQNTPNFAQMPS